MAGTKSMRPRRRGVQPPAEVLELLAATVPGSIRELEGALTRVLAHHRLEGRPLTVATTEKILAEVPTNLTQGDARA